MIPLLFDFYGNPGCLHSQGIKSRSVINVARKKVAKMLNCSPEEIIFTSSGSEGNNLAIVGTAMANYCEKKSSKKFVKNSVFGALLGGSIGYISGGKKGALLGASIGGCYNAFKLLKDFVMEDKVKIGKKFGNHIIVSCVEHPSIKKTCEYLESTGKFNVSYVGVDKDGLIKLDELRNCIRKETILISVMHANNEVGTVQPVEEISKICKENDILFHSDAAQSVGKMDVDVQKMGVDILTIVGHKFYAPKGVGALYVRKGTKIQRIIYGGGHEKGLRPGTENTLFISALGKACEMTMIELEERKVKLLEMREKLLSCIEKEIGKENFKVNGHKTKRLPNTLNISFHNINGSEVLKILKSDLCACASSGCLSNKKISNVLKQMKVPLDIAKGTIRFSVGIFNTLEEMELASVIIKKAILKYKEKI